MNNTRYNSLPSLLLWAANAVQDLPKRIQFQLVREALDLMADGNLRGDISEHWVDQYPEHRETFRDLYL